jgi:hypothetical protein
MHFKYDNGVYTSETDDSVVLGESSNTSNDDTAPTNTAPAGGGTQPTNTQAAPATTTNDDDEIIGSTLDFENTRGYSNYGFTSYNGKLDRTQALEKAKKEYLPMVKDLPAPLRAVAFDFAFNSEDPRASMMVAANIFSPQSKQQFYTNGKLDKAKVEREWSGVKSSVIAKYNKDPKAFLDAFDRERKRSYDNTNGADVKGNEWYARVDASRKVADRLLNKQTAPKNSAPAGGGQKKAAPAAKPKEDGMKTYVPGMYKNRKTK